MRLGLRRAPRARCARRTTRLVLALLLACPLVVAAPPAGAAPVAAAARVATEAPVAAAAPTCPAAYLDPVADRPQVNLRFRLTPGKSRIYGYQRIVFTPDLPIDRIVLRQWANMPKYRASGSAARVYKVVVSGAASRTYYPPNNLSTFVAFRLPKTVAAGEQLLITTSFRVMLPPRSGHRLGTDGRTAWWASGHPMLAWERGVGWATDPAGTLWGERTTSEDFWLRRLTVRTSTSDVVLASGTRTSTAIVADGVREHYFTDPAMRDVMVAVGRFRSTSRTVGTTRLVVGAAPSVPDSVDAVADTFARAMRAHIGRFGPFPYSELDVAVLPRVGGGVEFPGGIMMGAGEYKDSTASHEVAHEYFYGLVGNNQGRNPWLDEAFATYAEALHRGTGSTYLNMTIPADGRRRVGAPMTYWEEHQSSYWRSVYVQGAATLLRARSTAGAAAFDAAIRCYVRSRARRIARPGHLAQALDHLPAAREVLVRYGALPARYAP
jgi:hypothetical protein